MKPIIFNTTMVQAILDGKKTQTRRLIQFPDNNAFVYGFSDLLENNIRVFPWGKANQDRKILKKIAHDVSNCFDGFFEVKQPFIKGDILWVRETWKIVGWNENESKIAVRYKAEGGIKKKWICIADDDNGERFNNYWYQSSDDCEKAGLKTDEEGRYDWNKCEAPGRWRPSIHMPKEAARLFLKVKNVNVARLQDITDDEALSEGVPDDNNFPIDKIYCPHCHGEGAIQTFDKNTLGEIDIDCPNCLSPSKCFANLWDSIYKSKGKGWENDPWVWVIEFERCEKGA